MFFFLVLAAWDCNVRYESYPIFPQSCPNAHYERLVELRVSILAQDAEKKSDSALYGPRQKQTDSQEISEADGKQSTIELADGEEGIAGIVRMH